MNTKEIDKKYRAYSKYYKNLLVNEGIKDVDMRMSSYEKRLKDMYGSKEFEAHNVYPSTNVSFVYAVIAMCLELKEAGYTDERIVPAVEKCMEGRWNVFKLRYQAALQDILQYRSDSILRINEACEVCSPFRSVRWECLF